MMTPTQQKTLLDVVALFLLVGWVEVVGVSMEGI